MKIRLLYFHRAREAAGRASELAPLASSATAAEALDWAAARHPDLARLRPILRLAVNDEYVAGDQALHEGDTVAFLPPLSGG